VTKASNYDKTLVLFTSQNTQTTAINCWSVFNQCGSRQIGTFNYTSTRYSAI